MKLKIVTPDGIIFQGEKVKSTTIPTQAGTITILPDHEPLISILEPGELIVEKDGEVLSFAIARGILEVKKDSEVNILADNVVSAENINLEDAEEARRRAEEFLKRKDSMDDLEFAKIQALLEQELAKISVGRKYKRI